MLLEWHRTELASCFQGPVVEHWAYNLAIVHVAAELQTGFAVVDLNMEVDKSAEMLNMTCHVVSIHTSGILTTWT